MAVWGRAPAIRCDPPLLRNEPNAPGVGPPRQMTLGDPRAPGGPPHDRTTPPRDPPAPRPPPNLGEPEAPYPLPPKLGGRGGRPAPYPKWANAPPPTASSRPSARRSTIGGPDGGAGTIAPMTDGAGSPRAAHSSRRRPSAAPSAAKSSS